MPGGLGVFLQEGQKLPDRGRLGRWGIEDPLWVSVEVEAIPTGIADQSNPQLFCPFDREGGGGGSRDDEGGPHVGSFAEHLRRNPPGAQEQPPAGRDLSEQRLSHDLVQGVVPAHILGHDEQLLAVGSRRRSR